MFTFKEWCKLNEGGNVVINNTAAERIDLKKLNRQKVVSEIGKALKSISDSYKTLTGFPLWGDDLFKNKSFLSGSSLHLFNNEIPDETFIKHKPTVGDIDTQVDGNQKKQIEDFLQKLPSGEKVGNTLYVGYKPSGDQFITLWTIPALGISVQVDLELVDFKDGKPTPWSTFSHGSPWEDLSMGIKGVFQKYIFRSLQHRKAKDILILPKTPKGKEKIIHSGELAFNLKGLRYKIEPVLDKQGNHLIKNGMYVYRELDSKDSEYITDLELIYQMTFDKVPSKNDIAKMSSFVGVIDLIIQNFNKSEQKKVLDSFANLLWEKGAQGLVRGDPRADYDTKIVAFNYFITATNVGKLDDYSALIKNYYSGYK